MTTPTRAKIEAAAKEIRIMLATIGNPTPENLAYAALTAAAGVGNEALDGEKQLDDEIIKALDEAETIEAATNATIERCAQVCDDGTASGEFYAIKIRALKDKP